MADSPIGPVLALGSALSWGVADFAGGMFSRRLSAFAVVGVSQALSLVVLLAAMPFLGVPDTLAWLPWAILAGASGAVGLSAFYRSLAFGTVGVVSPISAMGAAIPVGIGLATGDNPAALQLVGIVLALLGAILASGPELRGEEHVKAQAIWFAVLAAGGFGITMWAIARGSESSPFMTLVGMRGTSVLGFAVIALIVRSLGGVKAKDLPGLALLGLGDVTANALLGISTTFGLLSISAVLSALYPVVTVALAAVILHERMKPIQLIGTALALLGVVLIAVV